MQINEKLNQFFSNMWHDYCSMNPQAQRVYDSLTSIGENVLNDHIAFRTFSHPKITVEKLAPHFTKYGYELAGEYEFKEKKLKAKHFAHFDVNMPKVFISELDLSQMSSFLRETVTQMTQTITDAEVGSESFIYSGRPWRASYEVYQRLNAESEYAAWVYAHGFRPNHFTVYINYLKQLTEIHALNDFLKKKGFTLNPSGGEVKGSPAAFLEQSSTMANIIPVQFEEGVYNITGCYYEFAKRYPMKDGKLFQGFVATSADKIFESTNQL